MHIGLVTHFGEGGGASPRSLSNESCKKYPMKAMGDFNLPRNRSLYPG